MAVIAGVLIVAAMAGVIGVYATRDERRAYRSGHADGYAAGVRTAYRTDDTL